MDRREKAVSFKQSGCNCCQAVILAYAEKTGLDSNTSMALGAAFGAGMGNAKGDCGALCGAQTVLGLLKYNGRPLGRDARTVYDEFSKRCGAVVCQDIKGLYTGVMLCSCDDCVGNAVDILEEIL